MATSELSVLVIWASSSQIMSTFPNSFKRFYHNVTVITDCTEVFMETSSSLVVQESFYSDYKHHCTVKFLVVITARNWFFRFIRSWRSSNGRLVK